MAPGACSPYHNKKSMPHRCSAIPGSGTQPYPSHANYLGPKRRRLRLPLNKMYEIGLPKAGLSRIRLIISLPQAN